MSDLRAVIGDSWSWSFTATLDGTNPYALTTSTRFLWFTVKSSLTQSDYDAPIRKTSASGGGVVVVNAPGGQGTVTLSTSDFTSIRNATTTTDVRGNLVWPRYYWDLQVKEIDTGAVYTLDKGEMAFTWDVTQLLGDVTLTPTVAAISFSSPTHTTTVS